MKFEDRGWSQNVAWGNWLRQYQARREAEQVARDAREAEKKEKKS